MIFRRDPCKNKGHDWQYYGWSVMGFGPYRYHLQCTRCEAIKEVSAEEIEYDDEDGPNTD